MKNKKLFSIAVGFAATLFASGLFVACKKDSQHKHDYAESVTESAECTEEGVKTFTCECGDTYTEVIPALGHDYKVVTSIAANCTDPEKEQVKCERCNDEKLQVKEGGQPALGHDWVTDRTISASCDEAEKVHQTCDRTDCDAERTIVKEGGQAALGHHYVADESTRLEPDCTHDGGVTMKCDREGCTDSYQDVILALGHTDDGTKDELHQATCEEEGYRIRHCSVCDTDYKTDNIAPLGHDYQADGKVAASCDTMGYDKYTCLNGCAIEKRENVVQNTEHTFDKQGVCTGCGKSATEAMAFIARATTPIEIVSVGNGTYEVYGMREKEHVIYIPYNVIEALVKQGVGSIIISIGAAMPSDPISVLAKIDGETKLTANFGAGQTGEVAVVKIGENGKVASSINSDGIALTVFYHDNYLNKVNRYVVGLTYVHAFDSQNVQTWYKTSLDVSGSPEEKVHVVSGMEDQAYYNLTVRPELIRYYAEQGAKSIKFSFISKEGQRVIFAVDYKVGDKGEALPAANYSVDVPELQITEAMLQSGVEFRILFADCSLLPEWAGVPLEKADGFRLQTLLVKEYDANDPANYFESSASWQANAALNEFTFSNCDIGNNTVIKIRPEYFADLANKGFSQTVITLSSKAGQNLTFSVVLDKNYMAKGSVSFTLDITDELKSNGISLPVYTTDNEGNADGFVMGIEKVYAFNQNNPLTFIRAQGTSGVTYADNVWTFDKTITAIDGAGDCYQEFTLSKQTIAFWMQKGYGRMIVDFAPKAGESMDMRFDTYHWEVSLADCVESGFAKSPFVAPRTAPGITGFTISVQLIKECAHNWDTENVEWTWNGYTGATAKINCTKGDHPQTLTANVQLTNEIPATCTEGGQKVYTATVEFNGQTYTDTKTETLNKLGHNYDTENIVWTWDGYTGATAKIVCLNGVHPETLTASVALTSETPATCTEDGQKVYTATITFNGRDYTDAKTETLNKLGHSYGEWIVVTEATAEDDGIKKKVCSVCQDEITERIPALGHVFDTEHILWSWEGYTVAQATFTCTAENDHTVSVTANIEVTSTIEATCTADGEKVYTATVEFNGNTYRDTKTETLTKLGHNYGAPVRVESTEDTEGSITETCSVCGDEKVTVIPAYLSALGTDSVTYNNGVWTFAKNATTDFNQQINVSKEAVAKWIDKGYSAVTLAIVHKDGEILGTQGVQTKWTVTLADCVENGYSLTAYIAPRNAEGGYGTITGFCVSAEFAMAFNSERPATYLTIPSTDGITYADGVWTAAKTAAYAADYYQDVVVRPETIALWMEQGYAKMTIAVSAKSGENTQIIYDGDFVYTVTFTEAMKTEGYTFPHIYIAPRSEGGMTGFNVTLELTEAFNPNKPEKFITAEGAERSAYADKVWTFDREGEYYDQYFTVKAEVVQKWIADGYGKMIIEIKSKDGESLNQNPVFNIVSRWEVTLTDCATTGFTDKTFIAPNSGTVTGFKIQVTLVEPFDENKPEKFITAADTEGITYADGVWTVAKTVTAIDGSSDFYQDIVVSGDAIAYWMEQGYAKMTIAVSAKSGENTQIIYDGDFVYTVTFTEAMKTEGYTFPHVFIAPRSEGGMTGFNVTLELTEAFNPNKPEKFITAEGAERSAYADNVWTFDREGEYYDQYFTVKAEVVQKWIADGYGKMIIEIKSKDGESLNQNPVFNIVSRWEVTLADCATTGFTDKTFIAPNSGTVTGFKIQVTLVEPFSASKIADCVTAANTEGVSYSDNTWTFAKTATAIDGSSDFYQDVIISGELIAYWSDLGYTGMTIAISAKEGESFVLLDITNPTNVEITDDIKTNGYTISHFYVAPRSGNGITGFVVSVTLS